MAWNKIYILVIYVMCMPELSKPKYFDPEYGYLTKDYDKDNQDCIPDPCDPESSCATCGPGSKVPHPDFCDQYFLCILNSDGESEPFSSPLSCEEDEIFDVMTGNCRNRTKFERCYSPCLNVECEYICENEDSTEPYLLADPTSCTSYKVCAIGSVETVHQCPDNTPYFNGSYCVQEDYRCCDHCIPYCTQGNIEVPDPYNCKRYYTCFEEGIPSLLNLSKCPDGEHFDPKRGICVTGNECTSRCQEEVTTSPKPASTTPDPETTSPEPASTAPDPETTSPKPASTTPDPETTSPKPASTTPDPETTSPKLASTTPDPETTSPESASTAPDPETTSPKPASTTPDPETTSPKPASTTPDPETTSPKPASTTPDPETTSPKPASTTPDPETTSPKPASTTPDPETTSPKPASTTPDPETTSPKPASTTPDPETTSPKPASTTLDPETTVPPQTSPAQNPTTEANSGP